jgi:hypothetical protein
MATNCENCGHRTNEVVGTCGLEDWLNADSLVTLFLPRTIASEWDRLGFSLRLRVCCGTSEGILEKRS